MELRNLTDKDISFGDIPDTKNVGGTKKIEAGLTGLVFDEDAERSSQLKKHMLAGNIEKVSDLEPTDSDPIADTTGLDPSNISSSLLPAAPYNVTVGTNQRSFAAGWFNEIKHDNTLTIRSTNNFGNINIMTKGHNPTIAGSGSVSLDCTSANEGGSLGGGAPLRGVKKMYSTNINGANTTAPFNIRLLTADPTDDVQDGDVWFKNASGTITLNLRVAGVTKSVTLA